MHPYNYAENKPLLEFHSKHGIVTEAYGSLAFVFHLFNDVEVGLNKKFIRSITTFPGGPVDAAVEKAAKRLGTSPGYFPMGESQRSRHCNVRLYIYMCVC